MCRDVRFSWGLERRTSNAAPLGFVLNLMFHPCSCVCRALGRRLAQTFWTQNFFYFFFFFYICVLWLVAKWCFHECFRSISAFAINTVQNETLMRLRVVQRLHSHIFFFFSAAAMSEVVCVHFFPIFSYCLFLIHPPLDYVIYTLCLIVGLFKLRISLRINKSDPSKKINPHIHIIKIK